MDSTGPTHHPVLLGVFFPVRGLHPRVRLQTPLERCTGGSPAGGAHRRAHRESNTGVHIIITPHVCNHLHRSLAAFKGPTRVRLLQGEASPLRAVRPGGERATGAQTEPAAARRTAREPLQLPRSRLRRGGPGLKGPVARTEMLAGDPE